MSGSGPRFHAHGCPPVTHAHAAGQPTVVTGRLCLTDATSSLCLFLGCPLFLLKLDVGQAVEGVWPGHLRHEGRGLLHLLATLFACGHSSSSSSSSGKEGTQRSQQQQQQVLSNQMQKKQSTYILKIGG